MELESETETARFPISFTGWLQIVDAARRGGATIEIDPDLPGSLQALIETPLPGDEAIKPVRTKAAKAKKDKKKTDDATEALKARKAWLEVVKAAS